MSDTSGTPQPGPDSSGGTPDPYAVPAPPSTGGSPVPPAPAYGASTPSEPPAYGAPPAPPYGQAPDYSQAPGYGPTPYSAPTGPGTDGVSIAALVTGVLFMGIVPLILGIIGLSRTKKNGTQGRGLAIAGIVLGILEILAGIAVTILFVIGFASIANEGTTEGSAFTYGDDAGLDALWDACEAGELGSCDDLYFSAPSGTEYEDFGYTCGGRTEDGELCEP